MGTLNATQQSSCQAQRLSEFTLKGFYYVALAFLTVNAGRPSSAAAQSIPEIPALPSKPEPHLAKHFPVSWVALSLAGQAAAFADVETTLNLKHEYSYFLTRTIPSRATSSHCLSQGTSRSLVMALTSIVSVAGFEMHKSSHRWERRMWWIPQRVQIGISAGAALHNADEPPLKSSARRRTRRSLSCSANCTLHEHKTCFLAGAGITAASDPSHHLLPKIERTVRSGTRQRV